MDKEIDDKKEFIAETMIEFIYNTIVGHESGFFKAHESMGLEKKDLKKSESMKPIVLIISSNYLNVVYKSLIREDDDYVISYFHKMKNALNHSLICLLNIVYVIVIASHNDIDRTKLNINSYDKYMKNVKEQLKIILENKKEFLKDKLNHECKGINIKDCDPDEDMFITNALL